MYQLSDWAISWGRVNHKLVKCNFLTVIFAILAWVPLFVELRIVWLNGIARDIEERIIVRVLHIVELRILLSVLPYDLWTIFVWFQAPKDDFFVVFTHSDEASVIFEPKDRLNLAIVAFKDSVDNPLVFPEAENLHIVVIVVGCVHVATIGELDLSAASDRMVVELGGGHVVGQQRVDAHSVKVPNDYVETTRVNSDRLDDIRQLLDNLQSEAARVRRILPDHKSVVSRCCSQDWLFHASCNGIDLVAMVRDCQIRYLAEVFCLFFLNAHLKYLPLARSVDQVVADLVHARDWEKWRRVLVFQEFVPFGVFWVDNCRHVAFKKLVRVP